VAFEAAHLTVSRFRWLESSLAGAQHATELVPLDGVIEIARSVKDRYEIGVLQGYMPAQLSEAEIDAIIADSVLEAGATGPKDMGKVIALVKPKVIGRADMGSLSELVKRKLATLA
jgi:hypothetical protein